MVICPKKRQEEIYKILQWKKMKPQKQKMHNIPLPYYQSYAACASQIEIHFFIAVCAHNNCTIGNVYAANAYAQSPPP